MIHSNKRKPIMFELNYLDLFSGIGGFPLGASMAGISFKRHYYSEINKF
jgi:DNA (cytosine-5)-methyltransferase 1